MQMMLFAACLAVAYGHKLYFDLDAKKRPTTKVVELLQGMQGQLESDAKADEETYDKFKCWCDENSKSKALSVKEAEEQSKQLQDRVEFLQAKSVRLKGEIETVEDEVAKNQAALDTASALRKQQAKEYAEDKQRLGGNLQAVNNAVSTMKSAPAGSFLQLPQVQAVRPVLQQLISKNEKISLADRETIQAFLQEQGDGDSVMGVLTALSDDFGEDLKVLEKEEAAHEEQYQGLANAKKDEIQAGTKQVESKKEEKAGAEEEKAHKKQEIKDLKAASGADMDFAAEVKTRCAEMAKQHGERVSTRAEEQEAISKAIQILNADEANANFAKTFGTSFLQETQRSRLQAAQQLIAKWVQKDARLAGLLLQMRIDKFEKVKKAIDEMAFALKKEQKDEVKQKDFCVESFQKNQVETETKAHSQESLLAKEGATAMEVEKASKEMEELKASIADLEKQMQVASQNREAENKEFQALIPEQRETQRLLKEALLALKDFYAKKPAGAMIQLHRADPKEPEGFKDYKANSQNFGVMSLLQQLLSDAQAMEGEATRAEQSSQKAYEKFAADTKASMASKEEALADKAFVKAGSEKTHVQTKQSREGVEAQLDALGETKKQLHESCDWLLKNFEGRQSAREEEIESIAKAKAILSGATFAEIQLD